MGVSFDPMEKVIGNQRKTGHGRWGEKDEGCARRNEREREEDENSEDGQTRNEVKIDSAGETSGSVLC